MRLSAIRDPGTRSIDAIGARSSQVTRYDAMYVVTNEAARATLNENSDSMFTISKSVRVGS